MISKELLGLKNQKFKGNILLLLTSFIWGTSFIAQSVGVETISPTAFNGIRSLIGSIALLPVIYFIDLSKKRNKSKIIPINKTLIIGGIVCGICLCLASTLQTAGMVYTSPGKSGFITALYMVIVPIIRLFTGKKPSPVVWCAVAVALVGMYLLCLDSDLTINIGDIMTMFCAVIFSFHILAIDYFSPKVDGVKLSCLQFFVCGIINVVWMFFDTPKPEFRPILSCWVSLCYSGVLSCSIAYTLQIVGQKYTDPTSASILMSLESVFSTLSTVILVALGWQLTGGTLSMREILGCVLMFAAILLVQIPDSKFSTNNKSDIKNAVM